VLFWQSPPLAVAPTDTFQPAVATGPRGGARTDHPPSATPCRWTGLVYRWPRATAGRESTPHSAGRLRLAERPWSMGRGAVAFQDAAIRRACPPPHPQLHRSAAIRMGAPLPPILAAQPFVVASRNRHHRGRQVTRGVQEWRTREKRTKRYTDSLLRATRLWRRVIDAATDSSGVLPG